MFATVLRFATTYRRYVIRVFQIGYLLSIMGMIAAYWLIATKNPLFSALYDAGKIFGTVSVAMFILTILPGIAGRFRFSHPLVTIGVLFRRHLGISTFLLALLHAQIVYFFPNFIARYFVVPPIYILFGSVSLYSMLALAATSNDWSVRKLGKRWKILHRLVYLILWTIFGHVAMQEFSTTALIIAAAGVLEIVSLIVSSNRSTAVRSVAQDGGVDSASTDSSAQTV